MLLKNRSEPFARSRIETNLSAALCCEYVQKGGAFCLHTAPMVGRGSEATATGPW